MTKRETMKLLPKQQGSRKLMRRWMSPFKESKATDTLLSYLLRIQLLELTALLEQGRKILHT